MQAWVSHSIPSARQRCRAQGFTSYSDTHAPAAFIGLYHEADRRAFVDHKGPRVAVVSGKDVKYVNERFAPIVCSYSKRKEVQARGAKPNVRNLFFGDPTRFEPRPLGLDVYCYVPWNRREEYGWATICACARELSGVRFWCVGARACPYPNMVPLDMMPLRELIDVYAQCYATIRPIDSDSCPQTLWEMSLMGRHVASNVDHGGLFTRVDKERMAAWLRDVMDAPDPTLPKAPRAANVLAEIAS